MTIENIKALQADELEQRFSEIEVEMKAEDANIEELSAEVDAIEERRAELKEIASKKAEEARAVAEGNGEVIVENIVKEERKMMDVKEYRNSEEYVNAYAEYVKTGEDAELRSLLSTNVGTGTIAVPDYVADVVKTAWDKNEIMSLVDKVQIQGNLKVNFEISGTDAVFHTEGGEAVAEETLVEGIVTIVPKNIKKWISVSDEVMAMRGQAFLDYIYSELTYRIVKKMADELVGMIAALPQTATSTSVSAAAITKAPAMGTVAEAIANLSDEASNPVIIMNKLTWSAFKDVQYANGYGADPFEGLAVKFNSTLPAYSAADADAVYMVVGDLGQGAMANFPEGDSIVFKFDEMSRKKEDLVEVLGREYVGLGLVACKAFTLVKKPA